MQMDPHNHPGQSTNNASLPKRPVEVNWDLTTLVDRTVMTFDGADKKNGSLYICNPGTSAGEVSVLVEVLRKAGLWSDQEPKQVADAHKAAYKEQLVLDEVIELSVNGQAIVLARCNHSKYPSDAERWAAWKRVFALALE